MITLVDARRVLGKLQRRDPWVGLEPEDGKVEARIACFEGFDTEPPAFAILTVVVEGRRRGGRLLVKVEIARVGLTVAAR